MEAYPGHQEHSTGHCEFNDEQVLLSALLIWPLELAWRVRIKSQRVDCATVNTLRKLPNDLGLQRAADAAKRW